MPLRRGEMRSGKTRMSVAAVLALALAAPAALHADHCHPGAGGGSHAEDAGRAAPKKKAKIVIVRGEVVDLACYMSHQGRGEKHRKCAKACLLKGAPVGIVTKSGKVYLVVEEHSKSSEIAFRKLKRLVGERVKLTGEKFVRGGMTALAVKRVSRTG